MDDLLRHALVERENAGLGRHLRREVMPYSAENASGRSRLSLGTNDYLGLSRDPQVIAAAQRAVSEYGAGATGSRLISGNLTIHRQLEEALARFKRSEAALVFPTGYQAAVGAISSLAGPGDLILSDELNHACLIDGCRLSRAMVRVYRHNDPDHARSLLADRESFSRCLIVTEGVFSMDGDLGALVALGRLRDEFACWLVVDDAHGTGVLGDCGRGTCNCLGVAAEAQIGTLSKALGSSGGFVCGSRVLVEFLIGGARSFLFTTALPPASAAAALAALEVIERCPDRIVQLTQNARALRDRLSQIGWNVPAGITPIIPVLIGDARQALRSAQMVNPELEVAAIRPPTVPAGKSRLRITATALLTNFDIDAISDEFARIWSAVSAEAS